MDQARVRAQSLEKTFGTEFKESLTIAKSLVKAFGISYDEAFDTIADGMIRGGAANDEFLKSFKEYPKLFAQAGFTVKDFQRIVNTGIDMGVYDDKLPDAIKEFSLSVMEQTASSRDALENAFGKKFTDDLFKGINDGSVTVKDSLILVSEEAENIGLNAQSAQKLTADLFRGAGEDAGGALIIFDAVTKSLIEQERALTPLEQQLENVTKATDKLDAAQNSALKSDKYAAWANDVSLSWTKVKTVFFNMVSGIGEGLANVESKLSRFRYQLRGFVSDAFSGKDTDWDKLGKEADAIQAAKEKIAGAQNEELLKSQKKEKQKSDPAFIAEQEAEKLKKENAEKANAEAIKLKEQRSQEAAAEKKKHLDALDDLEEEYTKKSEDREANSALKKAILEKERAVKKATEHGASKQLMDDINAAHDIKIQEEKTAEEKVELERLRAFDEKKRTLENELELAKATSDEEKAAIKAEQDLEKEELRFESEQEKFLASLELLQLNEEEKNSLLELMEENHQQKIQEIKGLSLEKINEQEKKWAASSLEATEGLENAKSAAQVAGLDILKSIFGEKSNVYKAFFLVEKALAGAEIVTTATKALAAITANTAIANAAAVAASPLTLGMPWVGINTATGIAQATTVKINTGIQLASLAGATIQGFDKGGYTDLFGMGTTDASGKEIAGVVHKNEYVVPEIVRRDPEVPQILQYLEGKRKKALGYASGGDTISTPQTNNTESEFPSSISGKRQEMLLEAILEAVSTNKDIYFGFEAEEKRQKTQRTLEKLKQKTQIKS